MAASALSQEGIALKKAMYRRIATMATAAAACKKRRGVLGDAFVQSACLLRMERPSDLICLVCLRFLLVWFVAARPPVAASI